MSYNEELESRNAALRAILEKILLLPSDAVRYTVAQSLTEAEKAQAQTNIGLGDEFVDTIAARALEMLECTPQVYVTPQMFGALSDGLTDDTAAIQSAFDSLTDGGVVYFPAGTYIVQHADNKTGEDYVAVLVEGKRGVTVVFDNGATIKHNLTTVNRYTMFRFSGCSGLEIRGGVIEGDRDEHPDVTTGYGSKGLHIVNSDRVYIHDMEIRSIFGDCIGVTGTGQQCENVIIENCTLHGSYRNGITIGGAKRACVRNCHIYNIHGAGPQSGIDMEAEYGYGNEGITVDNCHIHECAQKAIIFSSNSREIKVKDCYLDGRVSSANTSDNIEVINTTIVGAISAKNNTTLKNCVVGCLGCTDDADHPNVTVRAYNTIFRGIETSPTIGANSIQGTASLYFKDCEFHKVQSSTDVTYALFFSYGNDMDSVEVVVDGGIIDVLNDSAQNKVFASGNYKSFKLNDCQIVAKSAQMDYPLVRIDAADVDITNCIFDTRAVTAWTGGSVIMFGSPVKTFNCHGNIFTTNVAADRVLNLSYFAGSAYITHNTAVMFRSLYIKSTSAVVFDHGNTILDSVDFTAADKEKLDGL